MSTTSAPSWPASPIDSSGIWNARCRRHPRHSHTRRPAACETGSAHFDVHSSVTRSSSPTAPMQTSSRWSRIRSRPQCRCFTFEAGAFEVNEGSSSRSQRISQAPGISSASSNGSTTTRLTSMSRASCSSPASRSPVRPGPHGSRQGAARRSMCECRSGVTSAASWTPRSSTRPSRWPSTSSGDRATSRRGARRSRNCRRHLTSPMRHCASNASTSRRSRGRTPLHPSSCSRTACPRSVITGPSSSGR